MLPEYDKLNTLCEYVHHNNGVHELIVKVVSREGANAFGELLVMVHENWKKGDPPLLVLVNSSAGTLPLNYTMHHVQDRLNALQTMIPSRVAFLFKDMSLVPVVDSLLRMSHNTQQTNHFFRTDQREEAIDWLLSGE